LLPGVQRFHFSFSFVPAWSVLILRCDLLEDGDDADDSHAPGTGASTASGDPGNSRREGPVSVVAGSRVLSRSNRREAVLVVAHVRRLLGAGLKPGDIAVISPYNGQVDAIKALLAAADAEDDAEGFSFHARHQGAAAAAEEGEHATSGCIAQGRPAAKRRERKASASRAASSAPSVADADAAVLGRSNVVFRCSAVAVRSVDGFQGAEREAVVISLVRSNRRGDVG
jgi:hypothetical protein